MKNHIIHSQIYFSGKELSGEKVEYQIRNLENIQSIFSDRKAMETLDIKQPVYKVSSFVPETEDTLGGLNLGITHLYPGKVGQEYFMTKGHYHSQLDRTEYYWTIEGEGVLILMDESRNVWAEYMRPGSLHYIHSGVAHRVANTGNSILSFGACWPSDAGHDYETIEKQGFASRLVDIDGVPTLI